MKTIMTALLGTILTVIIIGLAKPAESTPAITQHRIIISGFEFVPKELTVSVGDKITWINNDIVPHNIAANTKQKSLSADFSSGETFSLIVKGSLSYICGLHPSMQGKLIVK
jgi:plastocyanin